MSPPQQIHIMETMHAFTSSITTPVSPASSASPVSPASHAQFTKEETTIVFDWDDTLLSSWWLAARGFRSKNTASLTQEMLDGCIELSSATASVLQKAKELGNVIIITNACEGWVETSCRIFMAAVLPILAGIPIISAQAKYKDRSPLPLMWKHYAFVEQMKEAFARDPCVKRNIISVGDGVAEMEAMRSMKLFYAGIHGSQTFIKNIKLLEKSDPRSLIVQLEKIGSELWAVTQQEGHLELLISPDSPAPAPAPTPVPTVSQKEETIDYIIKLEDRTFTIPFPLKEEIALIKIKEKIQEQEGFPIDQQILAYGGRRLEDGRSVEDYDIQPGATIHLILRLRGGMYHASSGRSGTSALFSPSALTFLSSSVLLPLPTQAPLPAHQG